MSDLTETRYGFTWGPLVVEREISDPKFGYVLKVRTGERALEIRSTPKGHELQVTSRPLYDYERQEGAKS